VLRKHYAHLLKLSGEDIDLTKRHWIEAAAERA
jgi:hypothetical protein